MRRTLICLAAILITIALTVPTVSCLKGSEKRTNPGDNKTGTNAISTNSTGTNLTSINTASDNAVLPTTNTPVFSVWIMGNMGIRIGDSQYIDFYGVTSSPDGTVLLSQLYDSNKALPWWPKDQPIIVKSGQWEIKVPLGVNGAPAHIWAGQFFIWHQDNPSMGGEISFPAGTPPPAAQ